MWEARSRLRLLWAASLAMPALSRGRSRNPVDVGHAPVDGVRRRRKKEGDSPAQMKQYKRALLGLLLARSGQPSFSRRCHAL